MAKTSRTLAMTSARDRFISPSPPAIPKSLGKKSPWQAYAWMSREETWIKGKILTFGVATVVGTNSGKSLGPLQRVTQRCPKLPESFMSGVLSHLSLSPPTVPAEILCLCKVDVPQGRSRHRLQRQARQPTYYHIALPVAVAIGHISTRRRI